MVRETEGTNDDSSLLAVKNNQMKSKRNLPSSNSLSTDREKTKQCSSPPPQPETTERRPVRKKFKSRSKSLDKHDSSVKKSPDNSAKLKKNNSKPASVKVVKSKSKPRTKKKVTSRENTAAMKEVVIKKRPQSLWSSDSDEEDSWDENNMAASHGYPHRSDHSYDDRDDLLFDSDEERGADNLENSDEDTEDASETDMATLEEELTEMKEKMYLEKMKDLRQQLDSLKQGTHPEYLEKLRVLDKQREDWIELAEVYREYELMEVEREYKKEKEQAKTEFETKKIDLKESLISELNEKKKSIENEKLTMELTGDVMEVKPVVTRKLRRRPNEPPPAPEKKRKTYSTQLNLLLSDEQIMADLKRLNRLGKSQLIEYKTAAVPTAKASKENCLEESSVVYEAKIEDGKLFYDKKWFQKGQSIYLESKEGSKFNGQIHSIGTSELWVKKLAEGTRLKIYLTSLHKGKYVIRRRGNTAQTNAKES